MILWIRGCTKDTGSVTHDHSPQKLQLPLLPAYLWSKLPGFREKKPGNFPKFPIGVLVVFCDVLIIWVVKRQQKTHCFFSSMYNHSLNNLCIPWEILRCPNQRAIFDGSLRWLFHPQTAWRQTPVIILIQMIWGFKYQPYQEVLEQSEVILDGVILYFLVSGWWLVDQKWFCFEHPKGHSKNSTVKTSRWNRSTMLIALSNQLLLCGSACFPNWLKLRAFTADFLVLEAIFPFGFCQDPRRETPTLRDLRLSPSLPATTIARLDNRIRGIQQLNVIKKGGYDKTCCLLTLRYLRIYSVSHQMDTYGHLLLMKHLNSWIDEGFRIRSWSSKTCNPCV